MAGRLGPRTAPTFDSNAAPTGYVAGLGRGAAGFMTRADIGPARRAAAAGGRGGPGGPGGPPEANFGPAPAGYVAGRGRGLGDPGAQPAQGGVKPAQPQQGGTASLQFDQFAGFQAELFADSPYDAEDREADRIYAAVDERMDARRKRRREERQLEDLRKQRAEQGKIGDQFADVKAAVAAMTAEEWSSVPDADTTRRKVRRANPLAEAFTPLPDSVIEGQRQAAAGAVVNEAQDHPGGDASSMPAGLAGVRGTVMGLKLDQVSDSVSGQTVVDPQGYLTGLDSVKVTSAAEIGDIKKARLLLRSVITTNPRHGPGWVAAARLEELAGKLVQARKLIREGTEACPGDEDVWLEAARLQTPDNARAVLTAAVQRLPTSVRLWEAAASLETAPARKRRVLRQALGVVPNSVKLWKAAVDLEEPAEARVLLKRATECVPDAVELWLALARLETYENAQAVLNDARKAVPTDASIWLAAAQLEEAQGDDASRVDRIVGMALQVLGAYGAAVEREQWLAFAEECEAAGARVTCAALVRHTIGLGVDAEDRRRTWTDDAEAAAARGAVETARAIFAHALAEFPTNEGLWTRAAELERAHGDTAEDGGRALRALLARAVQQCPRAEALWLMAAKSAQQQAGDLTEARAILREAYQANPESDRVMLAGVNLEWAAGEHARARALLLRARTQAPNGRVFVKSAVLERECGDAEAEAALLAEGLERFPGDFKLHLMQGQLAERRGDADAARAAYEEGTRRCPKAAPVWIALSRALAAAGSTTRARAVLERGVAVCGAPEVWVEAVRLEVRSGARKLGETLLARGLQTLPPAQAGRLYAEDVAMALPAVQRAKSAQALRACDSDPHVVLAIARIFWRGKSPDAARKWLKRCTTLDPDLGDGWAYWLAFERARGTPETQAAVLRKCALAEPRHGELWTAVSKGDWAAGRRTVEEVCGVVASGLGGL